MTATDEAALAELERVDLDRAHRGEWSIVGVGIRSLGSLVANGAGINRVWLANARAIVSAVNAVGPLVAEVRRLREDLADEKDKAAMWERTANAARDAYNRARGVNP